MKNFKTIIPLFLSTIAIIATLSVAQALADVRAQIEGATNFTGVHIQATALGTATPLLHIKNDGVSESIEVENSSGTPVFSVGNAGALTVAGDLSFSAGNSLAFGVQTEVITADTDLVPTDNYIRMTSTAAYTLSTTSSITTAGMTDGTMIILQNDNASDIITVDGTGGTVECKADVLLGASDTLALIYNDSDSVWNCLANYDNS